MTHHKTYITSVLCLILGMASTLYAHDEPDVNDINGIDPEHKHHYRSDRTLERADFYGEETGKLEVRAYFRTDGTKERGDFYDIKTGTVEKRQYFDLDGNVIRTERPNK